MSCTVPRYITATLVATRAAPGRGRSLVALQAAAAGEVLLREGPFALVLCDPNDSTSLDVSLAVELLKSGQDSDSQLTALQTNIEMLAPEDIASLARDSRSVSASLASTPTGGGPTLPIRALNALARVRVNALTVVGSSDGKRRGLGLYCAAAMINHDCDPSAGVWFDDDEDDGMHVVVRALRPLLAGEEVTIAYVERSFPRLHRRALLRHNFQFDCMCRRCGEEPPRAPEAPGSLSSEAEELCARGVDAYCNGHPEEALEIMQQAERALSEPFGSSASSLVVSGAASELSHELRRRVWRFLANAAVAQRQFVIAESALAALSASNTRLFPYHRHSRGSPASAPHLDSALTEADLARVRLALIQQEESEQGEPMLETSRTGSKGGARDREEATQLLRRAVAAVELMCGKGSELAIELQRQETAEEGPRSPTLTKVGSTVGRHELHRDAACTISTATNVSDAMRLLGAPQSLLLSSISARDVEVRMALAPRGASSTDPSAEYSAERAAAEPASESAAERAAEFSAGVPDVAGPPTKGTPEDFMGSLEFWDVWRRRKKLTCNEVGKCTCFEGVGSMF